MKVINIPKIKDIQTSEFILRDRPIKSKNNEKEDPIIEFIVINLYLFLEICKGIAQEKISIKNEINNKNDCVILSNWDKLT